MGLETWIPKHKVTWVLILIVIAFGLSIGESFLLGMHGQKSFQMGGLYSIILCAVEFSAHGTD